MESSENLKITKVYQVHPQVIDDRKIQVHEFLFIMIKLLTKVITLAFQIDLFIFYLGCQMRVHIIVKKWL